MKSLPTSISELRTGDVVSFKYKAELRYLLVVEPSKDEKLHGFKLGSLNDLELSQYFVKYMGIDTYDDMINSLGNKAYRSFFVDEVEDLKLLILDNIDYTIPDFDFEWGEAQRYPEFAALEKEGWISLASSGYEVKLSKIINDLNNVDLNFDTLLSQKRNNFYRALRQQKIEMPIVAKFPDGYLDLVSGNTRIAGLTLYDIDPTIWIVEVPYTVEP